MNALAIPEHVEPETDDNSNGPVRAPTDAEQREVAARAAYTQSLAEFESCQCDNSRADADCEHYGSILVYGRAWDAARVMLDTERACAVATVAATRPADEIATDLDLAYAHLAAAERDVARLEGELFSANGGLHT